MSVDKKTSFATLATIYQHPDSKARGATAQQRLREAYMAFADGRASKEDSDIIMVDLAKATGYYNTTSPDTPADVLKYYEGQRSIFGRIQMFINPSPTFMRALQQAVLTEQERDATLGEIQ